MEVIISLIVTGATQGWLILTLCSSILFGKIHPLV
jgi:hypothetical protein